MSPGPYWYDRKGNPLTMEEAVPLLMDSAARRVDETEVAGWLVSTVHLVLDHDWTRDGPPLIFETMIFPDCEYMERTPTEAAALAAHDRGVAFARDHGPKRGNRCD